MGMIMAVSFTRYGRLYYLDPGPHRPKVGDKVLVPTESGPEVAECVWAPQWVDEDIGGLPVCAGFAQEEHLARDEPNRRRRAEARSVAKRLIKRHGLPMKVVGVDYLDADNVFTRLLLRAAPRRLPRARPRPGPQPAGPGRAAADRPARRGPAAGRHRPVRARPVLRDVPQGLRAGLGPHGQGPGPAGQPAADRRRVRAADVLPEVRAPALPGVPGQRAAASAPQVETPEGPGTVVGPQRARRLGRGPAQRRRPPLRLLAGERVRAPAGVRGDLRRRRTTG